jgi:hypothetical protein
MNLMLLFGNIIRVVDTRSNPYIGLLTMGGGGVSTTLPLLSEENPPRIHIFLWLLSNNKILTQTILERRKRLMILHACFVLSLKVLITCSLNVVWLKMFGAQFLRCFSGWYGL